MTVLRAVRLARIRTGALLLLLLVASARPAYTFECSRVTPTSRATLTWPTRQIEWVLDPTVITAIHPNAEAEVIAAFDAWTTVGCSDLSLTYGGRVTGVTSSFEDGGAEYNAVVYVDDDWAYDDNAIAVTSSAFNVNTGQLLDADVELNGERFSFAIVNGPCDPRTRTIDLRNTLTHEVGHFIGLAHPPNRSEFEDVTMFNSAVMCETQKRTLEQDDINGICFIYPAGAPTQRCPAPPMTMAEDGDDEGGCTHTRRGRDGDRSATVVIGFAALAVLRRRLAC